MVSIASALLKQSQAVTDQAVVELRQAHMEDGSLQVSVCVRVRVCVCVSVLVNDGEHACVFRGRCACIGVACTS